MEAITLWELPEGTIVGNDLGDLAWHNYKDIPRTAATLYAIPTRCDRIIFEDSDGHPREQVDVDMHIVDAGGEKYRVRCAYAPLSRAWAIKGEPEKVFTMRDWIEGKDISS